MQQANFTFKYRQLFIAGGGKQLLQRFAIVRVQQRIEKGGAVVPGFTRIAQHIEQRIIDLQQIVLLLPVPDANLGRFCCQHKVSVQLPPRRVNQRIA